MSKKKSTDVVLLAEQAEVGTEVRVAGSARVVKTVRSRRHEQSVPRSVEHAEVERVPVAGDDSGEVETLSDGSLSIPVFEEEVVITTRLVVRERVIVRKQTVVEEQEISIDLRREVLEVEADEGLTVREG